MKSVKNIQKITKAMKMVAASKLRAIQLRAENSHGLWQPFTALLGDTPSVDVKKNVIVTVSADKGLCGGINSTSVKVSRALFMLNSGACKESKYVVLGEKAKAQLIRDSKLHIDLTMTELQKNFLNYTLVSALADEILKNVEYDALRIVFNKFKSVVSFIPTTAIIFSPEVNYSLLYVLHQVHSHKKAAAAAASGKFKDEIVPVHTKAILLVSLIALFVYYRFKGMVLATNRMLYKGPYWKQPWPGCQVL